MFLDQVIHFGKHLGNQVKGHSPKKDKIVDRGSIGSAPENMNLFYSPQRDPSPSSPFKGNLGDQVKGHSQKKSGKGSFTEKAKIIN